MELYAGSSLGGIFSGDRIVQEEFLRGRFDAGKTFREGIPLWMGFIVEE